METKSQFICIEIKQTTEYDNMTSQTYTAEWQWMTLKDIIICMYSNMYGRILSVFDFPLSVSITVN